MHSLSNPLLLTPRTRLRKLTCTDPILDAELKRQISLLAARPKEDRSLNGRPGAAKRYKANEIRAKAAKAEGGAAIGGATKKPRQPRTHAAAAAAAAAESAQKVAAAKAVAAARGQVRYSKVETGSPVAVPPGGVLPSQAAGYQGGHQPAPPRARPPQVRTMLLLLLLPLLLLLLLLLLVLTSLLQAAAVPRQRGDYALSANVPVAASASAFLDQVKALTMMMIPTATCHTPPVQRSSD